MAQSQQWVKVRWTSSSNECIVHEEWPLKESISKIHFQLIRVPNKQPYNRPWHSGISSHSACPDAPGTHIGFFTEPSLQVMVAVPRILVYAVEEAFPLATIRGAHISAGVSAIRTLLEACQVSQPCVRRKPNRNAPAQGSNPVQCAFPGPTPRHLTANGSAAEWHLTDAVSPTLPVIPSSLSLLGTFLMGHDAAVEWAVALVRIEIYYSEKVG